MAPESIATSLAKAALNAGGRVEPPVAPCRAWRLMFASAKSRFFRINVIIQSIWRPTSKPVPQGVDLAVIVAYPMTASRVRPHKPAHPTPRRYAVRLIVAATFPHFRALLSIPKPLSQTLRLRPVGSGLGVEG